MSYARPRLGSGQAALVAAGVMPGSIPGLSFWEEDQIWEQ
jgi:hypothetical protein